MPLAPRSRFGPYEIVAPLGAGGMGEVYRATDSRLKRDVAVKVLPNEVARDPERLARFEREAHLLASLNHPNIGAIYGVEESGGTRGLVLELVEGQTLAERMGGGPIAPAEAAVIALQIAEALEAAHEKGIVHRDLKPANVMISPDGSVKVLDFGLAKALEGEPGGEGSADLSLSPTLTVAATRVGVILGTASYMSPEQAKGKRVDRRCDIWTFGVILYEMLAGGRLFPGETVSDMLAAVLRAEVEWKALPAATPAPLLRMLRRCLDRDPRLRLRDIGEARIVLADVVAGRALEEPAPAAPPAVRRRWIAPAAIAGALAIAAFAALSGWSLKPAPAPPLRKFQIRAEDLATGPAFAVSPDGLSVAYAGKNRLWIRRLDKLEGREIPGTDGAAAPFWSPDSQWVGYLAEGRIRKVAVGGGESAVISRMPETFARGVGAAWGADGTILFSSGNGQIYEIPSRGGDPRPKIPIDPALGDDHFHEPAWLPGQRGILFTIHRRDAGVDTLALWAGGIRKVLLQLPKQEIWRPVYSPSGHILFRRQPENEGIWALPFSLSKLEPTGEPFLVMAGGNVPSVSGDGTLACVLGGGSGMQQLAWVDRKGEPQGLVGQPQPDILFVSVSPDGRRAVVQAHEGDDWDLWVHDLTRGTKARTTFESGGDWSPVWSPQGDRIVYYHEGKIFVRPSDGTGQPESPGAGEMPSFTPDGRSIVYELRGADGRRDIWTRPVSGAEAPAAVVQTASDEWAPRVSPDGRYVAYTSAESGHPEVYLRRFPGGEGKWQVSVEGGSHPIWSRTGDEIIYRDEDALVAVPIRMEPAPVLGTPQPLFDGAEKDLSLRPRSYDLSPDGRRLLVPKRMEKVVDRGQIVVITSWFTEFADSP